MSARADDGPTAHAALVADLLKPAAYPHEPAAVELIETHLSWVFLAGERVFKLKKPVDLGFVDQTDPAERRRLCHEELRLNRRLAPDVYEAVLPVRRGPDGWRVIDAPDPHPASSLAADAGSHPASAAGAATADDPPSDERDTLWAVAMRRLPAGQMLGRVLAEGALDNQLMEQLAQLLVGFHHEAASGPEVSRWGTPEAVSRLVLGNLDELSGFVAEQRSAQAGDPAGGAPEAGEAAVTCLSAAQHAFLRRALSGFLDEHAGLLARRVSEGRIREGHGDLHAGNLCLTDKGPLAYDALEFSPALRCGDVALDLAFLAMDLDRSGHRGFSRYLCRRYAALADDTELLTLLPFYKTHRALVRAKVACLRARELAAELDDGSRGGARASDGDALREHLAASLAEARGYAQLAVAYHLPPSLIVMCGAVGSGKSWLARRLARPCEALVLRSDLRRKQRAGRAATERGGDGLGEGLYAADAIERTYQALLDDALSSLDHGRAVVLDAGYGSARARTTVLDCARRLEHPVALVHVDTPRDLAHARVCDRAARDDDPSDAGPELFDALWGGFEPPDEVHAELLVRATPALTPEQVASAVLDRWIAQLG